MLKPKKIKLRTTRTTTETWSDEEEDYIENVLCSEQTLKKLENLLTEAREKIAQAAIIAEENNIEFRPLGDIFSSAEIESQGWSSSNRKKKKKAQKAIDKKLEEARKFIDEAYKIAKEYEEYIYFNPIAQLFSESEIEDCGWDSSHC